MIVYIRAYDCMDVGDTMSLRTPTFRTVNRGTGVGELTEKIHTSHSRAISRRYDKSHDRYP